VLELQIEENLPLGKARKRKSYKRTSNEGHVGFKRGRVPARHWEASSKLGAEKSWGTGRFLI